MTLNQFRVSYDTLHHHHYCHHYHMLHVVDVSADLSVELPPVARTWPHSLLRTCRQLWPLYTSAGISLCAIPGGKLQLPVLSKETEKQKAVLTATEKEKNLQ